MSLDLSTRLKMHTRKLDLARTPSQLQIISNNLKQDGTYEIIEDVMQAVDRVALLLASPKLDPEIAYNETITRLHQHLKVYGECLDTFFPDQLDRAFNVFRNCSQDSDRLELNSRVHLLELIELRAQKWKGNEFMKQYYKKKMESSGVNLADSMASMILSPNSPPVLAPGEVLKPSGKFKQPTRIPGKNYCKDEVVIRNADSGKVMGIKGRRVHMIEELSETIISFQRVNPGAKERLVQITGANEESITHAKALIEDTIKRNASPVREYGLASNNALTGSSSSVNSSASEESSFQTNRTARTLHHSLSTNDACFGEYKFTVSVGNDTIKITGNNLDLVKTSKLILDEHFSGVALQDVGQQFFSFDSLPQAVHSNELPASRWSPESLPSPINNSAIANGKEIPDDEDCAPAPLRKPHSSHYKAKKEISQDSCKNSCCYSVECMARLSMSPFALTLHPNWEQICEDYPQVVGKQTEIFNVEQFLNDKEKDD